jgi:MGT family glycosyltransferase
MSKEFLFASWEGGGNIPPMLTLVRRLLARGHRVRVLGDDASRAEIERSGAEFRPWRQGPNRPDRSPESDPQKDWTIKNPGELLPVLIEHTIVGPALGQARDVLDEVARRPADAVIGSDLQFGGLLGAEAAGLPHAVLACNLPYLPRPGVPPFGPGLMPAVSEEEAQMQAGMGQAFGALFAAGLPRFNQARAALGLEPLGDLLDQIRDADLHLVASAQAFDFPAAEQPANMRYVGPLLDAPDWAERFEHAWAEPERPLVLVAFSTTFQDQAGVLGKVVEALSLLPVNAVLTAGPACADLGIAGAENVLVVASGPHDAILRKAALCISHCGHGTVMRALSAGVPLLCMPMGRDQNDNAARLVWHGAGLRLIPGAAAEEIGVAVRSLITEPQFRHAAETLGAMIRAETDPARAAFLIEALAGGMSAGEVRSAA